MDDLREKPCPCGGILGEIIGVETRLTDGAKILVRRRWWCQDCNATEEAVGRERVVNKYC